MSRATRCSRGSVCVAGARVSRKRACESRRRQQAGGHRAQVPRAQARAAVIWCGGAGVGAWPALARVGQRRASMRRKRDTTAARARYRPVQGYPCPALPTRVGRAGQQPAIFTRLAPMHKKEGLVVLQVRFRVDRKSTGEVELTSPWRQAIGQLVKRRRHPVGGGNATCIILCQSSF